MSIDLETRSPVDISKSGVYRYAQDPGFSILLFGVSVNGGPVGVYDMACGEKIPEEIIRAVADNDVTKYAFNASFERVCLSVWLRRKYPQYFRGYGPPDDPANNYLDPVSWRCTMVLSAYNGLPLSLAQVGAVLGFEEQKMKEGKDLIRFFCTPSRTAGRDWNLPEHAPEKWDLFKKYNRRDVEVEMQIQRRLHKYSVPDFVWQEYCVDQQINDRGIRIDRQLVEQAVRMDELTKTELTAEMKKRTGLENPNSVVQLKGYLADHGMPVGSLGKKEVAAMIKDAPPEIADLLRLRLRAAKSSVKKYSAMLNTACEDDRCRGMFMFYGATRTGRWAGRNIQLQNLRRNDMPDLAQARELVREGDYEMLSLLYDSVPDVLSELVRTSFVPAEGMKYMVADYSAIEARVLAYLAGEQWVLDVFKNGGDIYCETASRMFGVPVEKHGQNADLRQKGKQATLSCGYGGSVGALRAMGALEAGMKEEELQPLVDFWRAANPNIVKFWWDVDRAAKDAIKQRTKVKVGLISFEAQSGMLFAHLPSGRRLSYVKPQIGGNRFGGESITYMGIDSTKHWSRIETFGGKLVENCIAEGTLVVTDCGLIPIQEITPDMHIWDGEEWVSHDGLIDQGIRPVITVGGIQMTPEHKVLTEGGWIEGGKADGFDWTDVLLPDGYPACGEHTAGKGTMALPVCMREGSHSSGCGSQRQEVSYKVLRMHAVQTDKPGAVQARDEPSSSLWGMALYEAAMPGSESSRIPQLRSTRNNCVRTMGRQLREFLDGHGADMAEGARPGQDRQQCRVQPRELPLDEQETELPEQADYPNDQNSILAAPRVGSSRIEWDRRNISAVQNESQLANRITVYHTEFPAHVYDIRNCGPRHRFAVWNGNRFCIVSNCVQAVSRDVLANAMKNLRDCRIVGHVHDELIIEAAPDASLQDICDQMGRTPEWLPGICLRADGYTCGFYMKDS